MRRGLGDEPSDSGALRYWRSPYWTSYLLPNRLNRVSGGGDAGTGLSFLGCWCTPSGDGGCGSGTVICSWGGSCEAAWGGAAAAA